ncbi:hypothetical protein AAC387_Pa04g1535 [Persea americana]
MEGLIPFVFNAIMKKRDGCEYKSLSDGSIRGHSFLLLENRGSFGDSSHKRRRSDFQTPTSEFLGWRSPDPDSHPSQMIHKRNSHQRTDSRRGLVDRSESEEHTNLVLEPAGTMAEHSSSQHETEIQNLKSASEAKGQMLKEILQQLAALNVKYEQLAASSHAEYEDRFEGRSFGRFPLCSSPLVLVSDSDPLSARPAAGVLRSILINQVLVFGVGSVIPIRSQPHGAVEFSGLEFDFAGQKDVLEELYQDTDISKEAAEIQDYIETLTHVPNASILDLFQRKYAHSVIVGVGQLIFQQFGGINGIGFYASETFVSAGFGRIGRSNESLPSLFWRKNYCSIL